MVANETPEFTVFQSGSIPIQSNHISSEFATPRRNLKNRIRKRAATPTMQMRRGFEDPYENINYGMEGFYRPQMSQHAGFGNADYRRARRDERHM